MARAVRKDLTLNTDHQPLFDDLLLTGPHFYVRSVLNAKLLFNDKRPRFNASRFKREANGFTIIETMIVLAIAGLIMLIIFQAIPALERSGRNNQRRQDVNTILGAVSRYELNDSGNFPLSCGNIASNNCTLAIRGNDNFLRYDTNQLTFYQPSTNWSAVQLEPNVAGSNLQNPNNIDKVLITNYQKCNPNSLGNSDAQGAGYSDVVALYAVESGSGYTPQCQQL